MAVWIQNWQDQRIPNSEHFTLTGQISSALIRTLNCHASLIEDLLNDGFRFVMTSRFQSDPIERRFGQYRQMSGGRFLVGLKDANLSEIIIKIKSLLKEGMNIDNSVKLCGNDDDKLEDLLLNVTSMNCTPENTTLFNDSREVAINIAG